MNNLAFSSAAAASVFPVDSSGGEDVSHKKRQNPPILKSGRVDTDLQIPRTAFPVSQCREAISVTRSDITLSDAFSSPLKRQNTNLDASHAPVKRVITSKISTMMSSGRM